MPVRGGATIERPLSFANGREQIHDPHGDGPRPGFQADLLVGIGGRQFLKVLEFLERVESPAVDGVDILEPRPLSAGAGTDFASDQNAFPQAVFFDDGTGNKRVAVLGGVVLRRIAEKAVALGVQFQNALDRARDFLAVVLDRAGFAGLAPAAVLMVLIAVAPAGLVASPDGTLAGTRIVSATFAAPASPAFSAGGAFIASAAVGIARGLSPVGPFVLVGFFRVRRASPRSSLVVPRVLVRDLFEIPVFQIERFRLFVGGGFGDGFRFLAGFGGFSAAGSAFGSLFRHGGILCGGRFHFGGGLFRRFRFLAARLADRLFLFGHVVRILVGQVFPKDFHFQFQFVHFRFFFPAGGAFGGRFRGGRRTLSSHKPFPYLVPFGM